MKRLAPSVLALCALAALAAHAEPPGAALSAKFQQLDSNADGKLSQEEIANPKGFARLDADGDGSVTVAEALQFFSKWKGPIPGDDAPQAKTTETAQSAPPREAPKALNSAASGIGSLIPDLPLRDISGGELRLTQFKDRAGVVLASVSPTCPVSKRYLPTLAALAAEYRKKNVDFLLLTGDQPDAYFRAALKAGGLDVPCIADQDGALRRALGATSSTDCFLLDPARTLVYRGAIDDQYGLGYSREEPTRRYLTMALDALLADRQPTLAATEAPGCALDLAPSTVKPAAPTYHGQVSRIMQAHCVECHRQGGVAPFALENYEQVTAKAGMIRKMVDRGLMPPWFAAAPAKGEHSPWKNDRSLAERERSELLAWLSDGKPLGDVAEAPRPRVWSSEWQIGQPDLVVQIPQPIEVKATGIMPYQHITVETGLEDDRWVQGFQVLPTAREVVHHVIVFIQLKDSPRNRDGGSLLAAYVPGNSSVVYPEGFAKALPAGARLRFQIHYTPNGAATRDQVKLGLLFAKEPPEHIVRVAEIINPRISIPPGAENHPETATIPVPRDVYVVSYHPHMHMRGKAFKYEALLPDGTTRTLLEVPRYDFNWQLAYRYAEPLPLAAGTKLRATGWFDNSANNPANPDPTATVRWGQQTTEEMMLGYVEYYLSAPDHPKKISAR